MSKKPSTMSVKDHIYRKLSQELEIPYPTIKKVLDDQFRSILGIISDPEINSIEIAGFGKLLINTRRLKKSIKEIEFLIPYYEEKLLEEGLDPKRKEVIEGYLKGFPIKLKSLETRLENINKKK
jgi:nucleoid DNA-binding protein